MTMKDLSELPGHLWHPQVTPGHPEPQSLGGTQGMIVEECHALRDLLLEKNRKYGDSALNPVRVFSRASPVDQILVRLDDKISRLRSSQADEDEDVIQDLLGYLILLRIARRLEKSRVP